MKKSSKKSSHEVNSFLGFNGFHQEFIHLSKRQDDEQAHLSFMEAMKPVNNSKNLYKNVYPYDQTRVKLSPIAGVEGSDYINASFVSSYMTHKSFIACQAPLKKTVDDFWRMIWEQKCGIIVNISEETDKKKEVCHFIVVAFRQSNGSILFKASERRKIKAWTKN